MRYWWVNQKQTYRHEVLGNYLWSPKRKSNGARNPYYEFMREVAPGDVIYSFADAAIRAIGIAASHAYEAPKPLEFGTAGAYWERIGWRVDVRFTEVRNPIKPAEHIAALRVYLPPKYAPLQPDGRGMQNLYLTRVPAPLAAVLNDLIGVEARRIIEPFEVRDEPLVQPALGLVEWEEHELQRVQSDASLPETDRNALVIARRGQGLFKERVMRLERKCRITGVEAPEHLRASHCKPWRDASNSERLDGENGLLLTPNADHLFDRGFIGFDDNGEVLFSPVANRESLARMGLDPTQRRNVGGFSTGQRRYLEYHRDNVLLRSRFTGDG